MLPESRIKQIAGNHCSSCRKLRQIQVQIPGKCQASLRKQTAFSAYAKNPVLSFKISIPALKCSEQKLSVAGCSGCHDRHAGIVRNFCLKKSIRHCGIRRNNKRHRPGSLTGQKRHKLLQNGGFPDYSKLLFPSLQAEPPLLFQRQIHKISVGINMVRKNQGLPVPLHRPHHFQIIFHHLLFLLPGLPALSAFQQNCAANASGCRCSTDAIVPSAGFQGF